MISFLKRAYTVMEVRTGFATGLPVLSGGLFGAYMSGHLSILPLILMFISGFSLNIVANIANEIRGFLANEESEKTLTGHLGSEGLVRGEAKLLDAFVMMFIMLFIGGASGLLIVWLTKDLMILLIGLVSVLAAIGYSLGPKPYILYPVGELVSGIFVGAISSYVSAYIQLGFFNKSILLYSIICMLMTVFLMSTNNTSDYEKDKGVRVTLPHVIGFRKSIEIIIPEFIIMLLCWISIYLIGDINIFIFVSGLFSFYYFGYVLWYRDYYKIEEGYPMMGRDWMPRVLKLIYGFNILMSIEFLVFIFLNK